MTTFTRNIRKDYLAQVPDFQPFYQHAPLNPDFPAIAAAKAAQAVDRALLAEVIRGQYASQGLETGQQVAQNLERLARPDSFTITTGHQLVLFGGPMFTVYKVLSTILLAERLSSQGMNVLPVFWIHTEDHDFEEINHYFQDFFTKKTYPGQFRSMVGGHLLEPSIEALRPESFPEALARCYAPGVSMREAFRAFAHELFGRFGLLILDADDPRLKSAFIPLMLREVEERMAFTAVSATSAAMAEAGYPTQIHPREVNLFYLDKDGRNRIAPSEEGFEAVDRDLRWNGEELKALILSHPERLSPNVCLRPLYQEVILPNLCYVGGWGELSYWFQLKGLFEQAGIPFPLLLPRISGTIFTADQASQWEELGFAPEDIHKPVHQLFDEYLPQVWDRSEMEAFQARILSLMDALEGYIREDVSETLSRSADALGTKTRHFLDNLAKKAGKIKRQQHSGPFAHIEKLKRAVEPDGMVQERTLSLASFAHLLSPAELISFLYAASDPLDFQARHWVLPVAEPFGNG